MIGGAGGAGRSRTERGRELEVWGTCRLISIGLVPAPWRMDVARPTITHPHAKLPENGGGQFDSKFNLCGTLPVAMRFGS